MALLPCDAQPVPAGVPPVVPAPSVRVVFPEDDGVTESSSVLLTMEALNLPALPEGNAPLRLILDNQVPTEVDDPTVPIGLTNLAEGGHLLRLYAVDGEGKMLGNSESFATVRFFVRRRDFQNALVPGLPWLTVNIPTGTPFFTEVLGQDAKVQTQAQARVALDFSVRGENTEGCQIHYQLNHREATVPAGKKIAWSDLKAGRYTLMVELLGADGLPVQGIFNQVQRTFDVQTPVKALSLVPVPSSASASANTATPPKKPH